MERELQKLSWMTIRQLVPTRIDTLIFPVGTMEAHGSSCVGTDNYIPKTLAEGMAERLEALIAPCVNYGVTRSLYRYGGGSLVSPETLGLYCREILDSFADTGFRNIILLNGHGGNNGALKKVAFDFHAEKKANICVIHWWELVDALTKEFFGDAGGHAGNNETAIVQAVDPALTSQEQFDEDLAYWYRPGADVYPVPGSILLYNEDEGYPTFDVEQSKEYREKVIEHVGDFAEMVIAKWRKFDL